MVPRGGVRFPARTILSVITQANQLICNTKLLLMGFVVDKMVDTFKSSYLFRKRDVFYFSRHVPVDVRAYYGFGRIVRSLRTKSHSRAVKRPIVWLEHLEQAWANIKLQHLGVLSLSPVGRETAISAMSK